MRAFRSRKLFCLLSILVIILCACWQAQSQENYSTSHLTSKDGLPQNSVRGLAFDRHGFLWLATEGGIARFDGRSFRTLSSGDLPGLNNSRFTHALTCMDSSIVFVDQLNGVYKLSNDQLTTLQPADIKNWDIPQSDGSLPYPSFMIEDSFFYKEAKHINANWLLHISILPSDPKKIYIVSDRLMVLDLLNHGRHIILSAITEGDKFALLNGELLRFDKNGQLFRLQPATNTFEPCVLTDESGRPWTASSPIVKLYNHFPFEDVLINDGQRLYRLLPTKDRSHFIISTVLDALPDNCFINDVAYRPSEDVLVLGTDSRGMFVYKRKYFSTYIYNEQKDANINSYYYASCLIDSNTLLASNGLLIDISTNTVKGHFDRPFNPILLCSSGRDNFYYTDSRQIFRYDTRHHASYLVKAYDQFTPYGITLIDSTVWVGTTAGIGFIRSDSLHWVHHSADRGARYGIKTIVIDADSNLWFGSYFQLYRLHFKTHQVDSFTLFENADCRALALIRGKLFIGTYGKGYYVYDHDRFIRMPAGRNNELSNTHTFVEDTNGYLWMSTNRGLYRTHLDAINAFLMDSTQQLDYYVYLEEDGIQSTEFNGGCSPAHLWMPDGRLTLPTIEGLVIFRPKEVPCHFPKDTIVIENIEADHVQYRKDQKIDIPPGHTGITLHFSSAWWNQPYNQYISYKLEGLHSQFQLCDIGQTVYNIGHLEPGKYTFVLRRRCGFGVDDYAYSRLNFTVLTPWYATNGAFLLFGIGFALAIWGTSVYYTRSIQRRNIELQRKVDEQTAALLLSNEKLESNLSQLAHSETVLRENLRIRDRLISIITHDILTPLRFIGKIATLGAEDKPADQNLSKRALADVQNAIQKLFHSTQNLLHWVTYQQEQFKITSANCSPFALVEQLFEDFREMSRFQDNALVNEVPEDDVMLTDPRILNIVLHNLISNAIKYTQHGQINVRSGVEHNWYVLEVSDNGRGMSSAQLESIRHGGAHQNDASMKDISAGNGIGLSLVAELVRALKGRWEIDSPDGAGVRVRVFLALDHYSLV